MVKKSGRVDMCVGWLWYIVLMEMFTIYKMIKANYEVDYDSVKVINS